MDRERLEETLGLVRHAAILDACVDGEPGRAAIAERAGCSRTTAYRSTETLIERGLLERTNRGYRTTPAGEALATAAGTLVDSVTAIDRLEPLLAAVDAPTLSANIHRFVDAGLTVADETDPYRAADRALELWEETDTVRGVLTAAGSRAAITEGTAMALEDGKTVTMCYSPEAIVQKEALDERGLEVYEGGDRVAAAVLPDPPFAFTVLDEVVTVVGSDGTTGIPTVLAESTDPGARTWLEKLFDRCLERATPIAEWSTPPQ